MADITTKTDLRNDYTPGPVTASFKKDTGLYYASFFHEAVKENDERIRFTGRILTVMLHPDKGTVLFYLKKYAAEWMLDQEKSNDPDKMIANATPGIEEELLDWCGKQVTQYFY